MLESLILIEPRLIAATAKARVATLSRIHIYIYRERERERFHIRISVPSRSSKIKTLTSYRFPSDLSQNDIGHTDFEIKTVIETNLYVAY